MRQGRDRGVYTERRPAPKKEQRAEDKPAPDVATPSCSGSPAAIELKDSWSEFHDQKTGDVVIPRRWQIDASEVPAGSKAAQRLAQLAKVERRENLEPAQIYRDPKTGSIAIQSSVYRKVDSKLYIYDAEGNGMGLGKFSAGGAVEWTLREGDAPKAKPRQRQADPEEWRDGGDVDTSAWDRHARGHGKI